MLYHHLRPMQVLQRHARQNHIQGTATTNNKYNMILKKHKISQLHVTLPNSENGLNQDNGQYVTTRF